MDMNLRRGRTPSVKKLGGETRSSESDGSETESKNGFDEHHGTGGVHDSRFSGFEIIQRIWEDRAVLEGEPLKGALLYTLRTLADF